MLDISIVLAVGFAALIVVLVRATITLADISNSLEKLCEGGIASGPRAEAPRRPQNYSRATDSATTTKAGEKQPDETEIAAVIAIAKAASEGSLAIPQKG